MWAMCWLCSSLTYFVLCLLECLGTNSSSTIWCFLECVNCKLKKEGLVSDKHRVITHKTSSDQNLSLHFYESSSQPTLHYQNKVIDDIIYDSMSMLQTKSMFYTSAQNTSSNCIIDCIQMVAKASQIFWRANMIRWYWQNKKFRK